MVLQSSNLVRTLACSYSVLIIHVAFLQLKSLSLSSGNSVDLQGILLCDY